MKRISTWECHGQYVNVSQQKMQPTSFTFLALSFDAANQIAITYLRSLSQGRDLVRGNEAIVPNITSLIQRSDVYYHLKHLNSLS